MKINWNVVVRNIIVVILVFVVARLNYIIKDLKSKIDLLSGQIEALKIEQVTEQVTEQVEEPVKNSAKMRVTAYCACKKCCRSKRLWNYSFGN